MTTQDQLDQLKLNYQDLLTRLTRLEKAAQASANVMYDVTLPPFCNKCGIYIDVKSPCVQSKAKCPMGLGSHEED